MLVRVDDMKRTRETCESCITCGRKVKGKLLDQIMLAEPDVVPKVAGRSFVVGFICFGKECWNTSSGLTQKGGFIEVVS